MKIKRVLTLILALVICVSTLGLVACDGKQHTIKFNANGGTVAVASMQIAKGDLIDELPTPTREGYVFKGWELPSSVQGEPGVKIENGRVYNWENDITLVAVWQKVITISFNLNGGKYDGGTEVQPILVEYGQTLTLPDSTKLSFDGKKFAYWTLNGSQVEDSQICEYTENVTLQAVWIELGSYSISYTLNGGTCDEELKKSFKAGDEITLPELTKTNYEFLGWSGSGIDGMEKTVQVDTSKEENLSFVANWKLLRYDVTVDLNIAGNGTPEYSGQTSFSVDVDTKVSEKLSAPTNGNEVYKFIGWVATVNGAQVQIDLANDTFNSAKFGEVDKLTIRALWVKGYKVTLDLRVYYDKEDSAVFPYELDEDKDGKVTFAVEKGKMLGDYIKFNPPVFKPAEKVTHNFEYWQFEKPNGSLVKVTFNTVFDSDTFGDGAEITLFIKVETWLGPF